MDTVIANNNIYSFIRYINRQPAYLIAINFGQEASSDNYRNYRGKFPPPGKFVPERGSVVLNSQNFKHAEYDVGKMVGFDKITLEPGQGLVLQFWPGF